MPNTETTMNTPRKANGNHAEHGPETQLGRPSENKLSTHTSAEVVKAKAGELLEDGKNAAGKLSEQVESRTRDAVDSVRGVVSQVEEKGAALLHDLEDTAAESYRSARDYSVELAHESSDIAQRAGTQAVSLVRRASLQTGRFMTTHALPLSLVGLSLGWLALSVRGERSRTLSVRRQPVRATPRATPQPLLPRNRHGAVERLDVESDNLFTP